MTYASLFAGIGGFDLALDRLGHTGVYANDFERTCKSVYDRHFKIPLDTRSITEVDEHTIPDHDLLVGGFPCQAFSTAGRKRGFEDTRGTLFFDVARIVRAKRPPYLLLENVKNLLNHDVGRTFEVILRTLDELGYDTQWQVVNSRDFGVPQNRERIIIAGHLRGVRRPKIFPLTGGTGSVPRQDQVQRAIRYPIKFAKRNQRTITGDYAYTLDTLGSGGVYVVGQGVRRFTPIEMERLQGFPDGWTEGVSDTQRYKQLGNAVTVNVIYEIAKRLPR